MTGELRSAEAADNPIPQMPITEVIVWTNLEALNTTLLPYTPSQKCESNKEVGQLFL